MLYQASNDAWLLSNTLYQISHNSSPRANVTMVTVWNDLMMLRCSNNKFRVMSWHVMIKYSSFLLKCANPFSILFFLKYVGSSLAWHRNADLYAVAVLEHRHNCKIVVLMGSQLTATWIIEGPSLYCALFFSSQELAVYIRHINLFFMVTYAWMLDRITLSIWFSTSFLYSMGLI